MTDDWRKRLATAVSPLSGGVRKLQVNNFRYAEDQLARPGRTAAVLVPVLDLPEPEIVLTRRAEHLSHHAGQVSFPGGAAQREDGSAVITALREADEEIGLKPAWVTPVGFLDRFDTISDFRVLPVVGLVNALDAWVIDPNEVAEVFTIPLSIALDRSRYKKQSAERHGQKYYIHSLAWNGHNIWGLTAAMMLNLSRRMEHASGPGDPM